MQSRNYWVLTRDEVICRPEACGPLYVTLHQLIEVFVRIIEGKDPFTKNHSEIVAVLAYMLALACGLPPRGADLIHLAGHLHDIGKLDIPDHILKKPGPLTKEEFEIVKLHPLKGFELLKDIKAFQGKGGVLDMILHHHERWDGKGYPFGLKGEEIPLGARIIAIADAFSAMVCKRPYRKPLSIDEAFEEIRRGAGTQFDPLLAGIFLDLSDKVISWVSPILEENNEVDIEFHH
ncbi:MAG: HD-GYP domain-containing protein [Desulfurococcaceae archaeon]